MSGIVLHVGLPKTGTTTIQQALFEKHSQIYYLGKNIQLEHDKGCLSQEIYDFLDPLLWHLKRSYDLPQAKQFYADTILSKSTDKQIILGSWEGLAMRSSSGFEQLIKRIASVSGGCKAMITLRNPLAWLPSYYLQQVKGNFLKRQTQHFNGKVFMDFDDWMAVNIKKSGGLKQWLSYYTNIRNSINILGTDNVGVFLFEELKSEPQSYYNKIANFLDIDNAETLALTEQKHFHPRLLKSHVDNIQSVNTSLKKRLQWRFSDQKKRKNMVGLNKKMEKDAIPASVKLSTEWIEKISAATREGNNWLVNELQVNLAKYDYPL